MSLGLKLAIPGLRTVGYVEREAYAAATLVARMEDKTLDCAPIWDTLESFDGSLYHRRVGIISAGFPCQNISPAGDRKGIDGEKSRLWHEIVRVIREVEPEFVFLENSAALINRGLARVLGDLANLGFDAEWSVFAAADIGAPHRRARTFIVAYAGSNRHTRVQQVGTPPTCSKSENVAHAASARRKRYDWRSLTPRRGGLMAITNCLQPEQLFPPRPDETEQWTQSLKAHPGLEPAICRMAYGSAYRVDRLRLVGNGVVPAVAARAWRELIGRILG